MKIRALVFAFGAIFLGASGLRAQFTWTGAGPTDDVNIAANWLGGVAPTGAGGEDLIFAAGGSFGPAFNLTFSVHNITVPSGGGSYNFNGAAQLTLTGDLITLPGSNQGALFGVPIYLAAGNHMITAGGSLENFGADIYLFSQMDGPGGLTKTGVSNLFVDHGGNTFTGPVNVNEGRIYVHGDGSLGTGLITLGVDGRLVAVDYYLDNHTTVLTNAISLASSSNFGLSDTIGSITISGAATAQGGLAGSTLQMNVEGTGRLTLGSLGETDPGTNFVFTEEGTTRIAGAASYTGTTLVMEGGSLIFGGAAPTGLMTADHDTPNNLDGYIGSEVTTNLQSGFLDHFNKANTKGIIGFDTAPGATATATFAGAIDLAGFNSLARLGTSTSAVLTGTITPQGSDYQFGGRGVLTVTSNLGGAYGLTADNGLQLYLGGSNSYTGDTLAVGGAAIVFDSANSISPNTFLTSEVNGYVGGTENTGLDAASFIAAFDVDSTRGIVGFDAVDPIAGRTVADNINMTVFTYDVYLGTSTKATLTGVITPAYGAYRFAAVRDGKLTIGSLLTGTESVYLGIDKSILAAVPTPIDVTFTPTITIDRANDYTGGTYFQSGQLIVGDSHALGNSTGVVNIVTTDSKSGLSADVDGVNIANPFLFSSDFYGFVLGGTHDFTLSGDFTSTVGFHGGLTKTGISTVFLSGDNSASDLSIDVNSGKIEFDSDHAAGTGDLNVHNNPDGTNHGRIAFTSANPSMGNLYGEDQTTIDLGAGTLTINENADSNYDGTISGAGGIIKAGTAKLSLGGNNTYSGTTTLAGGTLVAVTSGAFGTSSIVFNGGRLSTNPGVILSNPISFGVNGGTLGGNGTFAGNITIGAGVHLGPGNSVGLLTFTGGTTWGPSGTYDIEVQSAAGARGTGYDSIDVTGGLLFNATLGSPFKLNLISLDVSGVAGAVADFNSSTGYAWLIAHTDGVTGFNPANVTIDTTGFANSLAAGAFNVSVVGNDIYLNFSPVPEPSTYALLSLGLGALALSFRRRR